MAHYDTEPLGSLRVRKHSSMMDRDHPAELPSAALLSLVNGYQISQAIHVAAVLGLADQLRDGPQPCTALAAATGAQEQALYRLLRALASVGVFDEHADRHFALTPLSECLRSDAREPVGPWAVQIGEPSRWQAWGHLVHSVRTGENAFSAVQGMDVWTYRECHPEAGAVFNRAMTGNVRRIAAAVLAAYDFSQFACVVDVGGGQGSFLGALLTRHVALQGILFDQPHVVAGSLEPLDLVRERCRVVGGSFFDAVPAGGDAYVLKTVLHDWGDGDAVAILQVCRQAMGPAATLLVVERLLGGPNEDATAKFVALHMLVMPGGRERTREEFATLLAMAGLHLVSATPTTAGVSVVEAVSTAPSVAARRPVA